MENNPQFSELLRGILASNEGKQLLARMRQDDGTLRRAAQAYQSGDFATAQALLTPLAQSDEAAAVLEKIDRK